jgi:beta-phosphoglucomutase family hydrolase
MSPDLGLPVHVRTCLFDLDGVLTQTASVHAAAWKEMFDGFLKARAAKAGRLLHPFDIHHDYERFVDGRPREDGVRAFLASRRITLPEGSVDDPPGAETVQGLGNRKNELFLQRVKKDGVKRYEGSVRYLEAARLAGLKVAVVTASRNCDEVLKAARLDGCFDAMVDGNVTARERLHGKPAPDTYLFAARELHAQAAEAAVYEDALAGVAAGRAGRFGLVVGVDRVGHRDALRKHGADIVVKDLSELMHR